MKKEKSLLGKMILAFTLLIIIPLSIVGVIALSSSSELLIGQMKTNIVSSTNQTTTYFDLLLKTVESFSVQLNNDPEVQDFYGKNLLSAAEETTNRTNVKNKMMNLTGTNSYLAALSVVRSDGDLIMVSTAETTFLPSNVDPAELGEADWYQKMAENIGFNVWLDEHGIGKVEGSKEHSITLGKMTRSVLGSEKYDFVLVDLDLKEIEEHLEQIKIGAGDATYAITPTGKIISPLGEEDAFSEENTAFMEELMGRVSASPSDLYETVLKNNTYLVSYEQSQVTGWIFYTMVPKSEVTAKAQQLTWKIVILGIVFVIFAVLIGIIFSLTINKGLTQLKRAMADAEKGKLSTRIESRRADEIGAVMKSFNSMTENISTLIVHSKSMTENVNGVSTGLIHISDDSFKAATAISQAVEQITELSEEQTGELDNCVQATNQLAEKINQVVDNTVNMQRASQRVGQLTDSGMEIIGDLNDRTRESNQITSAFVSNITELSKDTNNIQNILQVLDGISEQTTLLSFNATIEAARASEFGRGFSVVADEIRKLAETSGESTKEIQLLIENIMKNVKSAIALAQKTESAMEKQTQIVGEAGKLFLQIRDTSGQLVESIQKITSLVGNMDSDKEQVVKSIYSITRASEHNAAATQEVNGLTQTQLASVEELVAIGNQLHTLAEQLSGSMEQFIVAGEENGEAMTV